MPARRASRSPSLARIRAAALGIQADLRVFTRLGVFGTTAITAITAQNTPRRAVLDPVAPRMVRAQIDAVADRPSSRCREERHARNCIHCRAGRARLARHDAERGMCSIPDVSSSTVPRCSIGMASAPLRRDLLSHSRPWSTPNLAEAAALTGEPVTSIASMRRAALLLVDRDGADIRPDHRRPSPRAARPPMSSTTADPPHASIRHTRIATRHTHGTGCTLSAAITAHLALGSSLLAAVTAAGLLRPPRLATPAVSRLGHGPSRLAIPSTLDFLLSTLYSLLSTSFYSPISSSLSLCVPARRAATRSQSRTARSKTGATAAAFASTLADRAARQRLLPHW